MAFHYSPKIVTDGLEFYIDAANPKSYVSGSTTEYDLVGSQDMILNNGVTYSSDNLGCLVFDGLNDYTQTVNIYTYTETTSWDVWFNRTKSNNVLNMPWSNLLPYLAFGNDNTFHFSFGTKLSGVFTQLSLLTNSTFLDNTWYNVCCTLHQDLTSGDAIVNIYVNGELERTFTFNGVLDELYNSSQALRIGNHGGVSYPFEGKIPSLKIYNKILSADEIRQNYTALKSRFEL